jgi:hypothetical protein
VLLILAQVLVFNSMYLWGYVTLYPYLLFLLLLRFDINKTNLLLIGFFTGLTVDFFQNTLGMQAATATLLVFARPAVLRFYFKTLEFAPREELGISKLGFSGFLKYTFTLVLFHHFLLFFLEAFTVSGFLETIQKVLVNAVVTTVVIMIIEMLFSKKKKTI